MIKFYLLYSLMLASFFGFGQTETILKGKIVSENTAISNADVINVTSKKVVVSNEFGEFTIPVKRADVLVVVAKNCFERQIYLSTAILNQPKLTIEITQKANELKEVIVQKEKLVKPIDITNAGKLNSYNSTMAANQSGVYTGETINGMDLVAIGKLIGKLFKKKKKQKITTVNFKEYIAENVDETFLHKTLKLSDTDYFRFLDFCEADPNVNKLIEEDNQFDIINFLYNKKDAFDKL
jgi:hypothetical protein